MENLVDFQRIGPLNINNSDVLKYLYLPFLGIGIGHEER